MEKIDLRGLDEVLGIYAPWSIHSAKVQETTRAIDVHVDTGERARLFGLLSQNRRKSFANANTCSWQYMMFGRYRVVIHAPIETQRASSSVLNYDELNQPCFLGNHQRKYSNFLRQQVVHLHALDARRDQIAHSLALPAQLVETILEDLSGVSTQIQALSGMPMELDPVWERVLRGEILLTTQTLPLKLLLSKLQLATAGISRSADLIPLAMDLRKFFIANAWILGREIEQIFGSTLLPAQRKAAEPVQKLVLPALINPVWQELITGKVNLRSGNVALNLLISRQRIQHESGSNPRSRLEAIEVLREYFHKNHRSLQPELLLLNRACAMREKTRYRLPEADHLVWQQILEDDTVIPSNHMAYKLLLTRLRAQVRHQPSNAIKLDAANRIREFIKQNHKSMKQELVYLINQTKDAA